MNTDRPITLDRLVRMIGGVIVLAILRQAIGAGQAPPNQVIVGLSLFLTFFVMAPVIDRINTDAVQPYMAGTIETTDALQRAAGGDQLTVDK